MTGGLGDFGTDAVMVVDMAFGLDGSGVGTNGLMYGLVGRATLVLLLLLTSLSLEGCLVEEAGSVVTEVVSGTAVSCRIMNN